MKKVKLFIENFLIYGFGGIVSKIIPLIMVPIITRLMPNTDYYGISDLSHTVVQFGSAFAVMGMYDAMYRMFFEKEDEEFQKKVCSTALFFTLLSSLVVFILMISFRRLIAEYFFGNNQYSYIVYLSAMATLVGATNSIISAPTRMQNKRKIFLVTNTVSPILAYAVSVPLLIAGYYTIALPMAAVVSGISMEICFGIMNRKWFALRKFDTNLLKKMLKIAVPLMPNFLIYWVFNSCDKVMITNMLGIADAGVYAVGSKLGHCSQLIYTAFAGGWQFFAFSTMRENDQVESNSKIFEYLGIVSFAVSFFVCAWSNVIFKILFTDIYWGAYIVAPYLFMAPLLQMLFQVAGNQFLIIKKTWPTMLILSVGALVNILINFFLIPILGIEGASIATLVGYAVSVIVCVLTLCKMKLMVVSKRFLFAACLMVCYMILWRICFVDNVLVGTIIALIFLLMYALIYRKLLGQIIKVILNKVVKR